MISTEPIDFWPRRSSRVRRGGVAISVAVSLALLAACGDDGEALPDTIEVVATDYAFDDLPEQIGTDTVITMRNDSTVEVHELVVFALPDDIEGEAVDILALPDDDLAAFMDGPPALVVVAPPGGADPFVPAGDGTLTEPGRYLLFCAIPTGADPDTYLTAAADSDGPPAVDGGPPHFVHGMAATIEVVDA